MGKHLIDRSKYDHPEHFDDVIREYKSSERYYPTPLENLLFELAGHRCTLCKAPWLEIHHIEELSKGGETKYENLIVLCPNCHTRVHSENVPNQKELIQYKAKQEISYELPILNNISGAEWKFLKQIIDTHFDNRVFYESISFHKVSIRTGFSDDLYLEARKIAMKSLRCSYLVSCGIISVNIENTVQLANSLRDKETYSVTISTKVTSKGLKWLRYIENSDYVKELLEKNKNWEPPTCEVEEINMM
ncbi:MAG: hypothetical protein A2033_15980 [Bacteroidetes bacterium GWA2_31_9]|nr:MAG: hypothetical protein A2033_15980 [Bacteroidetes bacterium GWA2_31_9]